MRLLLAAACSCLLKRVAQPWPLKGGVKPRQGKPSSVIKTRTRTELGPSLAYYNNAWEVTVEERPLALEICLHGQDDRPEAQLKNGSFSPQNGPPCGTTA